jgi:hypothetical protein
MWKILIVVAASLISVPAVWILTIGQHVTSGVYSTKEDNPKSITIRRSIYPYRHWKWSGIFPLYGGFIPDPHIIHSAPVTMSEALKEKYGDPNLRYQAFDINDAFHDASSEIVLAIEYLGNVFEYVLEAPPGSRTISGLVLGEPTDFVLFSFDEGVAIYATMSLGGVPSALPSDEGEAFYFIDEPFRKKKEQLKREPLTSPRSRELIKYYSEEKRYKSIQPLFCNHPYVTAKKLFEANFSACENELNGKSGS